MGLTTRSAAMFTLACILATALGGCGSGQSVWVTSYQGFKPHSPAGVDWPMPTIRDVLWERLQQTRAALEADIVASDTHPDDWPPDKRAEAKAKLLRGLQVQGDPSQIEVLGRSEFTTTSTIDVHQGDLARFGHDLGATRIIYSTKFLGKADKIVDEPVTTYVDRYDWHRDRDGRRRYAPTTESRTTWVPVVVRADEHAWVAYFLSVNADLPWARGEHAPAATDPAATTAPPPSR